jgi:hypothetical protein
MHALTITGRRSRSVAEAKNRCPYFAGLVLAAIAGMSLAAPAFAQAPKDQVAFKATVGPYLGDVHMVPLSPPIAYARQNTKGEATLLGPFTYLGSHNLQFGVDGIPISVGDGIGALTAANGDALFISFTGLLRVTATGLAAESSYVVTGGRGRFAGATGSGVARSSANSKNEISMVLEGTVSAPKAQ